jgi:hypothetical protein
MEWRCSLSVMVSPPTGGAIFSLSNTDSSTIDTSQMIGNAATQGAALYLYQVRHNSSITAVFSCLCS